MMEKRKRLWFYQLVITDNYQKAISRELRQLVQWVSLNVQDLTSSSSSSEEDVSKNYKAVYHQLSCLHRASEGLYNILQETKAGLSSPPESLHESLDEPLTKLLLFPCDRYGSELHSPQVKPSGGSGQSWGGCTRQALGQKDNQSVIGANVQPLKVNEALDAPAPTADQRPERHRAGLTVAGCREVPRSEIPVQEEEKPSARRPGGDDGGSLPNAQSSRMDKVSSNSPCSNPPDGSEVAGDRRSLAIEQPVRPSPALLGEDNPAFGQRRLSDGLTYIVRSQHEVWETIEFSLSSSASSSSVSDGGCAGAGEKRENEARVRDVEPSSRDEGVAVNGGGSPRCRRGPRDTPETPTDSGGATERVPDLPEFRYCQWQELEIRVSHVIDPQHFYIQHCGPDLPRLMRELNSECRWSGDALNCLPSIGRCVSAWLPHAGHWYRARVISVVGLEPATGGGEDTDDTKAQAAGAIVLEMLCVDFGYSVYCPLDSLKYLQPAFCVLPQQALLVSLANISPLGGSVWSRLVVGWFRNTVKNATFFARFYPGTDRMVVELFSNTGKIGIVRRGSKLSQRLGEAGIAIHSDICCVSPKAGASIPLQWKQRLVKYLIQPRHIGK